MAALSGHSFLGVISYVCGWLPILDDKQAFEKYNWTHVILTFEFLNFCLYFSCAKDKFLQITC